MSTYRDLARSNTPFRRGTTITPLARRLAAEFLELIGRQPYSDDLRAAITGLLGPNIDPLDVYCKSCKAAIDEPCDTVRVDFHSTRVDAANVWRRGYPVVVDNAAFYAAGGRVERTPEGRFLMVTSAEWNRIST